MELYGKRSLFSFIDEARSKSINPSSSILPSNLTISNQAMNDHLDITFSPARPSIATPNKVTHTITPTSPDSPRMLSPLHFTPSPSLLYHCIASLHRREGNIYSIAVSRGIIFTGSESNRIRAWRQQDCIERGYVKAKSGDVRALLAHGNMIFSSHKDHKVRVWNFSVSESFRSKKLSTLPRRAPLLPFPKSTTQQHKDCVSCMGYYHAEGLLYTGSYDRTVKVWRISENQCVDSFLAHEDNVNAILVNQDDGCLFTCSFDGSVKIWRKVYRENSHTLTMTLKLQESPVNALALSSTFGNCLLYSGSSDGTINFWEKEKFSCRYNHGGFLQGHRFAVLCLVAIENMIFSGSEDTTIRVWRREGGGSNFHECLAVLDGHRGPVRCLAAFLEMENVVMGFLVYSASLDQTFKVWRVKVMPEANTCLDYTDRSRDSRSTKTMDYEISPVLSPAWVERKREGSYFH